jgi:hypothetical protein
VNTHEYGIWALTVHKKREKADNEDMSEQGSLAKP